MKVGRGHKWQYAAGEWVEKKLTPDQWEFSYAVNKQRHGRAPAGSGVPVGTAYHWYILADQTVTKLDANTYSTAMSGAKFKLAHKRADKEAWSASERAQRKRLIQILEEMLAQLKAQPEAGEQEGFVGRAGTAPATQAPAKSTTAAQPAAQSTAAARSTAAASNGRRARAASGPAARKGSGKSNGKVKAARTEPTRARGGRPAARHAA